MLKYYDFSGVSFLVDKRFKCENASENAAPRFDPIHNPIVPYLTDSKTTPFSAPSRGRLYIHSRVATIITRYYSIGFFPFLEVPEAG